VFCGGSVAQSLVLCVVFCGGSVAQSLVLCVVFCGVRRVTRSLVLCVCFVDRCLFLVGFVVLLDL
jgi:hypothetical protein